MTKHCCTGMEQFSRTRSEQFVWRAEIQRKFGDNALAGLSDPHDPLVEFRADFGLYVFGHVALDFCPWCGTDLKPLRVGLDKFSN